MDLTIGVTTPPSIVGRLWRSRDHRAYEAELALNAKTPQIAHHSGDVNHVNTWVVLGW